MRSDQFGEPVVKHTPNPFGLCRLDSPEDIPDLMSRAAALLLVLLGHERNGTSPPEVVLHAAHEAANQLYLTVGHVNWQSGRSIARGESLH